MINSLPPGLLLILAAGLLPLLGTNSRKVAVLALPLLTLWLIWTLPAASPLPFLQYHLDLMHPSPAGRLFATAFALMAFASSLFSLGQARTPELVGSFLQAGSAIGVCFCGDWLSFFLFWEMLALASTLVIWSAQTSRAEGAGLRYLLLHILGGMLLLGGILSHLSHGGALQLQALAANTPAQLLILAGILINTGAPPFSAWVADAYPEASPNGTVFLSAYTTKTAVFALFLCFPGTKLLIPLGLFMIFYGIFYALLENNIRRILAYSIVNQVGFMVTAIGIGTPLALNGATAHAFAHIIYKALLLMTAATVITATGKQRCTELGGLFRQMPLTTSCSIIGALSISAFPLTSGFISKSMISQAAAIDSQGQWLWLLLMAASAGVFLHAGIKFPWYVFFQKETGLPAKDPLWPQRTAMLLFSGICLGLGIYPAPLYALLPYPVDYQPYTFAHVLSQTQLLLFSGLTFFLFLPWMKRTQTISLDIDWFYRRLGFRLATVLFAKTHIAHAFLERSMRRYSTQIIRYLARYYGPQGRFSQTWLTGKMALLVVVFLAAYLILNFI